MKEAMSVVLSLAEARAIEILTAALGPVDLLRVEES